MGTMFTLLGLLAFVAGITMLGGWLVVSVYRNDVYGDWKKRPRHKCGRVVADREAPPICPHCGETEGWTQPICRYRWGWEFKG